MPPISTAACRLPAALEQEQEADAGAHEYFIRAALMDYAQRFGALRLAEAAARSLSPFKIEVCYDADAICKRDAARTGQDASAGAGQAGQVTGLL